VEAFGGTGRPLRRFAGVSGKLGSSEVSGKLGSSEREKVIVSVTVSAIPEAKEYVVFVDDQPAGFIEFKARPGVIEFLHTEIKPEFGGQGLGGKLVRYALDDVRKMGLAVLPHCPFVRRFIATHEEYLDLVPAESRAEFDL
jgi:predicted GNAT family acetyltransferase